MIDERHLHIRGDKPFEKIKEFLKLVTPLEIDTLRRIWEKDKNRSILVISYREIRETEKGQVEIKVTTNKGSYRFTGFSYPNNTNYISDYSIGKID